MRRCIVIATQYDLTLKKTIEVSRTEAWFHKFTTESDPDGTYAMAIVEHDDGSCETVPVHLIIFKHPGGG